MTIILSSCLTYYIFVNQGSYDMLPTKFKKKKLSKYIKYIYTFIRTTVVRTNFRLFIIVDLPRFVLRKTKLS